MLRNRKRQPNYKKFLFIFSLSILACVAFILLNQLLPTVFAFLTTRGSHNLITPLVKNITADDVKKMLREKNIDFSDVMVSSDGATIVVTIKDDSRAIFSTEKDIDWQVSSLHALILRLTIDNKKASYIDLRFDKPIVKF